MRRGGLDPDRLSTTEVEPFPQPAQSEFFRYLFKR
jgi:hypothetical protein